MEVGTTVSTGPCVPIILGVLLSCADLVVERKEADVASGTKWRMLRRFLNLTRGSILVPACQEMRMEKR